MSSFESVLALEVMPDSLVNRMVLPGELHTLETPKLSHEAVKSFFTGSYTKLNPLRRRMPDYYVSQPDFLLNRYLKSRKVDREMFLSLRKTFCEEAFSKVDYLCDEALVGLSQYDTEIPAHIETNLSAREISSLAHLQKPIALPFVDSDIQKVYEGFELYKKYVSPVSQLTQENLNKDIERCLMSVPEVKSLHGECLLQKILMKEILKPKKADLKPDVERFLTWFSSISPNTPSYEKFKEAAEMLAKY
jgi:hypothetical protein